MLQGMKPEKLKPLSGQFRRQIAKGWLAVVKGKQPHFSLDHEAVLQLCAAISEDRKLAALHVDFEKVDRGDFCNVIQFAGRQGNAARHRHTAAKTKQVGAGGIRRKDRGKA